MGEKRYYWLKLYSDFFSSVRIKKLRKLAGGDTYLTIYLKMQLLAMQHDGILRWSGVEDDFAAELALELDEEVDNVKVTMAYLLSCGLAETDDNVNFFFPFAVSNVGSEGTSAQRMRDARKLAKQNAGTENVPLEANDVRTLCEQRSIEIEIRDRDRDKRKDKKKDTEDMCAEPEKSASTPPVISLILHDNSYFDVTNDDYVKWKELYPAVDVMQELRKMAGWCDSNQTKRKTRRGVRAFITAWLAREQDKGGSSRKTTQSLKNAVPTEYGSPEDFYK